MPSFTIHLAVAKKYLETHKQENEQEFLNGVIAPDLKDKATSHFGKYSSCPDLNKYCKEVGLNSSYDRGYFLHLLTDDLFYNKFLEQFSKEIYNDYDKINKALIEKYNLQIPEKVKEKVQFANGETKILNLENICKFIETVGSLELESYVQEKQGIEIE